MGCFLDNVHFVNFFVVYKLASCVCFMLLLFFFPHIMWLNSVDKRKGLADKSATDDNT